MAAKVHGGREPFIDIICKLTKNSYGEEEYEILSTFELPIRQEIYSETFPWSQGEKHWQYTRSDYQQEITKNYLRTCSEGNQVYESA